MQCPYRNSARESGCDLVDDLSGIAGAVAREFCDYRQCQECPLFQEALQENLKEWSKHSEAENERICSPTSGEQMFASPVPGFWKLVLEHRHHET
jgi:hypothetical protein